MPLVHISKQLDQMEDQYEALGPLRVHSVSEATKQENVLIVTLQTLSTWLKQIKKLAGTEDALFQQAITLNERLKQRMRDASQIILQSINQEYGTKFQLHEAMIENEAYYYRHGVLQTIQTSGILNDLFQQILTNNIPAHPRDEYPLTRQMRRTFIIHAGPTNSGKTHDAIHRLSNVSNGIYLAPLRLLALEIYERLQREGLPCHLLTGEESIVSPGANHISCTIEKADYSTVFDVAVIDEGQMIADRQRGYAWTRAVLGIRAKEVRICCSPEAVTLYKKLIDDCGDEYKVIEHHRHTPLRVENESFAFPEDARKGDALIVFSRKEALRVAQILGERLMKCSVIYGNLPPETRRKQVNLFLNGETEAVVSTDAIGLGVNLPIRRVVFLETEKFDGTATRALTSQEIKQIAGRAGRRGLYEYGYVNATANRETIERQLTIKEKDLAFAYIAPHDFTILQLPFGSLLERLKAWNRYDVKVTHFRKADISEEIALLEIASEYEAILHHEQLYKAVTIPFNYKDKKLLNQWFSYLDCLKQNRTRLPKPKLRGGQLSAMETYYQAIGLYYAFSVKFNLAYDARWVRSERRRTSEQIHQWLKEQGNEHGSP